MRKIIYLLTGFIIYSLSLSAQNCTLLGCSKNYTITINGSLPSVVVGPEWACFSSFPIKQVFWQFFYSPTGGNYTQSISNTASSGPAADLDWIVFDMGTTLLATSCPVSPTGWALVQCDFSLDPGGPTGPGVKSIVATTAGHYYALAVISTDAANATGTFSTPQIGGSNLTAANCLGILPVKLISFTGELQNKNVLLKWVTAEEVNVSHYEVESSTNARNFKTIGNVAASTNNSGKYSLVHADANSSTGVIYYRLKTVDVDGKLSFSSIIKIQLKGSSRMQITENPVLSNLNISGLNGKGQIRVIDLTGKVLLEKKVQSQAMSINIPFIQTGMYILQYADGTTTETQKFIKR